MKKILSIIIAIALFGLGLAGLNVAQASTLESENLIVTLPDSVVISGSEIGSSSNRRSCSIKASLDSKPGTTIPLRAGAVVNLVDSTGYSVDSGYAIADVEGLTHLDIVMVFKCGNGDGSATLKGPYRFTTIWRGTAGVPFAPDSPVNVTFSPMVPVPSPTPTPIAPAPTPMPSPIDASKAALASALDTVATLSSTNAELKSQILSLNAELASALKSVDQKTNTSSRTLANCYRIAKSIVISKKGTLSKACLKL